MKEGFWIGAILSLIVILFLVYGGSPRGMFWRIEDNRVAIKRLDDYLRVTVTVYDDVIQKLEKRMTEEESKRWYGR